MTEALVPYISNPCPDCGQWTFHNPCEYCGHAFGVGRVFGDLQLEQEVAVLRTQKVGLEQELAEAKQMLKLQGELIDKQNQEIERLRNALDAVEFEQFPDGFEYCPWCESSSRYGHAPDCQRQQALKSC